MYNAHFWQIHEDFSKILVKAIGSNLLSVTNQQINAYTITLHTTPVVSSANGSREKSESRSRWLEAETKTLRRQRKERESQPRWWRPKEEDQDARRGCTSTPKEIRWKETGEITSYCIIKNSVWCMLGCVHVGFVCENVILMMVKLLFVQYM